MSRKSQKNLVTLRSPNNGIVGLSCELRVTAGVDQEPARKGALEGSEPLKEVWTRCPFLLLNSEA